MRDARDRRLGAEAAPSQFVLATANPDKAREISEILGPSLVLLPRPPSVAEVEETGETLVDNARLKAMSIASWTGRPAIGDDTALEVDALGGAPGVRSARFAGEDASYSDNVAKLLRCLSDHTDGRRARFRTVAMACWPDGREVVTEGVVEGRICERPLGHSGFGYDPVFVPDEGDGRTFAEMSGEEKHRLSHRGRAFRALGRMLNAGTASNSPA